MVVKNGSRLCGTGAARASTPILQNKAYWEVKVQQGGEWSCGVGEPFKCFSPTIKTHFKSKRLILDSNSGVPDEKFLGY